jgi:enolase
MGSSKIYSVTAREILDSRGNPTIEVMTILESGYRGVASVPSGASKGTFEALELRDGDKNHFAGMGVLKAVTNVNKLINTKIKGLDALNQFEIDKAMLELDGTENKSNLGANAILGVSLATAAASANHQRIPLYSYINQLFNHIYPTKIEKISTPTFNMINGGLHGSGNLDFQEFHVIPASNMRFHDALEAGVVIYYAIKQILIYRNANHGIGDEGGFTPNLYTNLDALELLIESIKNTKYRFGVDVFLGLDVAATHFKKDSGYLIKDRPSAYSRDEFINYFIELHKKFHLLTLEDGLEEDDWEGWVKLTNALGHDVLIIGDDFLATNLNRLTKAIAEKACSALLAKPNQIGSLSEFLNVAGLAKKNNIKIITSHRSGETTDTFVADLAVGIQSEYVKFGAPARGERVVKYNRLLQIENELFPY